MESGQKPPCFGCQTKRQVTKCNLPFGQFNNNWKQAMSGRGGVVTTDEDFVIYISTNTYVGGSEFIF